ncbi:MAG: elongation factor G [Planctomycetes bacterium]|nr:elongation factor G [Planctomycetota bacterium]MBI3836262.1 elongation factor G [Planctomycetota bacterium]
MALFEPDQIRNIALVGHGLAGKTSLAEALLFKAGATNRLGKVQDKSSILDSTEEAREKLHSLDSSICHFAHKGLHINVIDTPGTVAFCGLAIAALAAVECAVVVVSASAGVQVNTRRMLERAREYGIGVWLVINHIDAPNVDLAKIFSDLQESFGTQCLPLNLPTKGGKGVIDCFANESGESDILDVSETHTAVIEAIVAADDALMEKYLGGGLDTAEARAVAARAVGSGAFTPIFFTNSLGDVGIAEFMDALAAFCPSPKSGFRRTFVHGDAKTPVEPALDKPFIGQVFKINTDPKSNIKYLSIRIHSGKLIAEMAIKTVAEPKGMRPGHLIRTLGADHKEIETAGVGDIIALAKLDLKIGDTVFADKPGEIPMPRFPQPMFSLAVESKSRGDEDKISAAFRRYAEEDPCFVMDRGAGGQMVARGMGDVQLRTYLHRLAKQKVEVETKPPRIPYRETIIGTAKDIEYTHKKQSGGAGQFGRVVINVLPAARGEGYEFVDKIFGGSIDQPFRVSTDKGIRAQMAEGVLAGYPVVDVKVELIDGKTHPVDSKDIAFQIAGRGAFKEGFMKAKPVLLEPIVHVEVICPGENVGDIQGDLASHRGRPQGQDTLPGGMAMIKAIVPLAELSDYSSRLSSITGGQGSYAMEFSHYEPLPSNVQQQIVEAYRKEHSGAAS